MVPARLSFSEILSRPCRSKVRCQEAKMLSPSRMGRQLLACAFVMAVFLAISIGPDYGTRAAAHQQLPGGGQQGREAPGRGGGGSFGPEPIVLDDHTGF